MTRALIALSRSAHHRGIPPLAIALLVCLGFAAWPSYHPSPLPSLGRLVQTVIGAAPEYSAAPVEMGNVQSRWEVFETQTLPVEAVPQDMASGTQEVTSSPAGNGASAVRSAGTESFGPESEAPGDGSGALLKFRKSAHPSVFFPFAIHQLAHAVRPSAMRPALAQTKPTGNPPQIRSIHTLADAGLVLHGAIGGAISGTTIGRRTPALGIIGGGIPAAAKIAATINGATFRPTF